MSESGEEEIAGEMAPDPLDDAGDPGAEESHGGESEREPDEPAADPPPRSQNDIDALNRKLEAEAVRHAKRVAEIMGDDFALLVPSPVDWTPGFIFNVPEMHPAPEQMAALHELLGGARLPELREAEDAEACDRCDALGLTLTGSRVLGQETKPCSGCNGTGWKTKVPALAAVPQFSGSGGTAQVVYTPTPETYQVKDSWGRPAGHPHFGIDPVAVGA